MADLMLSFSARIVSGSGQFCIRATDGGDPFEIRLQSDGKRPRQRRISSCIAADKPIPGVAGCCDRGRRRTVCRGFLDRPAVPAGAGRPDGGGVALRAARTAAFAAGNSDGDRRPRAGGDGSIFAGVPGRVLHRNRSAARDRLGEPTGPCGLPRTNTMFWATTARFPTTAAIGPIGGGVAAKLLIGKPLAAIPSVEITPWRGWHFQVPNPRRIRYIQ